ncbi:MAG: SurA N-terminal domain-containing protein [Blastocatellia bacterium]
MQKTLIPVTIIFFSLALSACGGGAASSPGAPASSAGGTEVAANVNGKKVLVADVDRATRQQLGGQESQLSPLELAAARLQALDTLVTQEVLYQRAQKDNLQPKEEEVTQAIQSKKQELGLTEEAFQKQLKEVSQTEGEYREDARRQLAISKLYEKMATSLTVRDLEVEEFFKSNPSLFVAEPGVQVSDIIVDPGENGYKNDVQGEAAAQQKVQGIYNRLKSGSDFATIARGESEHQSAFNGGDLGFIQQAQFAALPQQGLPAALGPTLWSMKEGDITAPIRDQRGAWHIFKLTSKRTEKRDLTLNDPEVRKQISDAIIGRRKQLVEASLVARARDEARVENFLAQRVLENPNSLGMLRPVPQAGASPAGSPAAKPAASPAAASPASTPAAAAAPQKK